MFRPEVILQKKSTLFGIVVIGIMGTLMIPIIIPHIFHGLHVIHIGLHVGGLILAVFITLIASMAYFRLKTKRLLITLTAFGMFTIAESLLLIEGTWPYVFRIMDLSLLEVGHILTIGTLGLLALGVFRND